MIILQTIKTHGPALKSFYYHRELPEDVENMKGVVLVLHGLEGHGLRYRYFAKKLAKEGYGVFAIDHIGHGLSIYEKSELGDWKGQDFEKSSVNIYYLASEIKKHYGNPPIFLAGFDFGGFFAQFLIHKHPAKFDGVILSGCGKNNFRQYRLYALATLRHVLLPSRSRSTVIYKKRLSGFSKAYAPVKTRYDWLSDDQNEVEKFILDPLCGFTGTIGYYHEYYSNVIRIPEKLHFRKTKKDIPLLFIYSTNDVVTHRGKDTKRLVSFFKKKGFNNISTHEYKTPRHDIFFNKNKDQIIERTIQWLNSQKEFVKGKNFEKSESENKKTLSLLKNEKF